MRSDRMPSLAGTEAREMRKEHMAASGLIRWGAICLALGGATWVVLGLLAAIGLLQAIPGREDVVLFVAALLLSAVGLVGLHALQKDGYGRLGRVGLCIALAAVAARVSGAVVFLAGGSALEWISFPGTFAMLVGFVLYGVATLRAGVLPHWYGIALVVAMPVSLPLAVYGTVLFGLILLGLGCALWLRRDVASDPPSRVG